MLEISVETHRSGVFTFRVGADPEALHSLLDKFEYGHRLFNSLPLLPEIVSQVEKETLVASIHGTDTIEGGDLSEEEISAVIEATAEITLEERQRRAANLAQAYLQWVEQRAAAFPSGRCVVDEEFIRQLHRTVCDGLDKENYRPGLYRDNDKGIVTKVGDASHGGVYKPPQAGVDIKMLMGVFVDWLNRDELMSLPSPVRAALAHYYFERIHPFRDGNGRVGRLLERTILMSGGFKYPARGLDQYYLEHVDDYFLHFNRARKAEKTAPKTCHQEFIVFVLMGLTEAVERLHQRASRLIGRLLVGAWLGRLLSQKEINQRQYDILEYLASLPDGVRLDELKRRTWYRALYRNYSAATESRDWKDLLARGLAQKTEGGRVALKRG
jgi:Fic family protein